MYKGKISEKKKELYLFLYQTFMVKFSKCDWIAHLLDDANEVPLHCCFNENQIVTKVLRRNLTGFA